MLVHKILVSDLHIFFGLSPLVNMLNSITKYENCQCTRIPRRLEPTDNMIMDKENMGPLSPMKIDEISFYENDSPRRIECDGTSPTHCSHNIVDMVDDFDPSSQDSGYGTTYNPTLRRFVSFLSPTRSSKASFGSLGSTDDDFLESMSDFEPIDENLPVNFRTLINGELSTMTENVNFKMSPQDTNLRPLFRRALSLHNESSTPNTRRVRSCLFQGEEVKSFKRPEPPTSSEDFSPLQPKRSKLFLENDNVAKPVLKRAFSASEETIKYAVQRSAEEELIGDFSRTYTLPLTQGRHQDLKSITSETLARLMKGEFKDTVASFKVIDCRYPYEFSGGHIDGALNIYTKEKCLELLNQRSLDEKDDKIHILIFHCEFSSERGPNLFRYLRQMDRSKNEAAYPALQYPEIYLLEGGYKSFFTEFSEMCVPVAYKQMLHPGHEEDLRYFRMKSKTWNSDTRQRSNRVNLKRLGL